MNNTQSWKIYVAEASRVSAFLRTMRSRHPEDTELLSYGLNTDEVAVCFVAKIMGRVVGSITVTNGERLPGYELYLVYVAPKYRRYGIALQLVIHGLRACKERGAKRVFATAENEMASNLLKHKAIPEDLLAMVKPYEHWRDPPATREDVTLKTKKLFQAIMAIVPKPSRPLRKSASRDL